ncbi:hypothetical protein DFJ74DRAFT_640393 [Hyaloraphidium curvatum]|nr:hypothetical protein DFJ74DRAFT_640393 [Hyaloraphidium curvatum]
MSDDGFDWEAITAMVAASALSAGSGGGSGVAAEADAGAADAFPPGAKGHRWSAADVGSAVSSSATVLAGQKGAVADAGATLPASLRPAIEAFYDTSHAMCPIIHKASFEAAFAGPSFAYPEPPLALAYAAAACGARSLPKTSREQRFKLAFSCVDEARRLLRRKRTADLESAQAYCLLLDVISPAGMPATAFPVLKKACDTAQSLSDALDTEGTPATAEDWLRREMVCRLRIGVAAYDLAVASYAGRPTIASYFHRQLFPLPVGERWYDAPDPQAAFEELKEQWAASGGPPSIAFGETSSTGMLGTIRSLVAHVFLHRGSVVTLLHLANFERHLLLSVSRLDPSARRSAAAALSGSTAFLRPAFPPALAEPYLTNGDPRAILEGWEGHFPRFPHALAAVQLLLASTCYAVERLRTSGFRGAACALAVSCARTARGLLRADRAVKFVHYMAAPAMFAAGSVLLAAISEDWAAGEAEGAGDAGERREAVRWLASGLEALGRKYGLNIKKVADRFRAAAEEAGIALDRPAPSGPDGEDDPTPAHGSGGSDAEGGGSAEFFGDVLKQGSGGLVAEPERGGSGGVSPRVSAGSLK